MIKAKFILVVCLFLLGDIARAQMRHGHHLHRQRGRRREAPPAAGRDAGDPLYLTPYLQSGDLEGAREAARVGPLPGLDPADAEQPESYSGFLTVGDPDTDSNMFFWFWPATDVDPADAPVSTWLQGGPGSSSLYGMLELNGPFIVRYGENYPADPNDLSAVANPYTWSKVANMLYIDNPVGAGFSYSTLDGLPNNQEEVGDNLYEFLLQWFALFPEFQPNDFYAFGESYAGKYIPTIATRILAENPTADIQINLAGIGIGNGVMSPEDQFVYGDLLFEMGYADAILREEIKEVEGVIGEEARQGNYFEAYQAWDAVLELFITETRCDNYYDFTLCAYPPEDNNYRDYLALDETRLAMHVGDLPFGEQSDECYLALIDDIARSKREEIESLMEQMPVLLYNGGYDIICNHAGILNMFAAMENWSGLDEYYSNRRTVYEVAGETAGYLKSAGNLRLLMVRNAAHPVPQLQPEVALEMFEAFINGNLDN